MDDYKLLPQFLIDALNKKRALNPAEASMAGKYANPSNQVGLGDIASSLDPVSAGVRGYNQLSSMNPQDFAKAALSMQSGALPFLPKDMRNKYVNTALQGITGAADIFPATVIGGAGAKAGAREIARQIQEGTGLFGKAVIDPRMYVYKPTFPSKPLPEGVGSTFEREQVRDLLPVRDLSSDDLLGASVFTFPADSTNFGLKTLSFSGNKIKPEFQTIGEGGIPFGRSVENQSKDIGFASNESAAVAQQDRYEIERLKNIARGGSGRIIVAPTTMKNVANEAGGEAFSLQPVRQINALVQSLGIQPKDLVKLDDMVRNTKGGKYKGWVGMADPYAMEQLATANGVDVGKADLVKKVYEKYISKDAQKTLGFNVEDLRGSLLDPRLKDAPSNSMGELWYEVNFNKGLTPSKQGSSHKDYTTDMGGNYLGTTKLQKTGDVFGKLYDDILASIPTVDKNGKKIPQATRELNAVNVLRSQKENSSLFVDKPELERLKGLLGL